MNNPALQIMEEHKAMARASKAIVKTDDVLLVPLFDKDTANKRITVQWQQAMRNRSASYYALRVHNVTNGKEVPFFIATELYEDSTAADPNHIKNMASLIEGQGYKIKVNSRLRYGQKDAQGELRFVVMHDTERHPYQSRFMETAIASAVANGSVCVAQAFGYGDSAEKMANFANNYIGDYLHVFW